MQKIVFPHVASFFSFPFFATTLVLFFSSSPALTIFKSSSLTGKPLVESSRSSTRSCHPPSLHVVCVSIQFLSLMNRNLITGLHLNTFHLFLLRLLGFDVLSSSTGSGYGLAYRWPLSPDWTRLRTFAISIHLCSHICQLNTFVLTSLRLRSDNDIIGELHSRVSALEESEAALRDTYGSPYR